VNIKGSNSFLDYCNAVDRYIGYISIANLGFTFNKLGLNSVIFILSMGGILIAS
jgi:hypothetical protein